MKRPLFLIFTEAKTVEAIINEAWQALQAYREATANDLDEDEDEQ